MQHNKHLDPFSFLHQEERGPRPRLGSGLDRRQFGRLTATLCALGCVEGHALARALGPSPQRLSWRAFRNAEAEGFWLLEDVEGEVPKDLFGTLYRIAPGQSDNHGTVLQHFFDGDAFVSAFGFENGRVHLRARFLATPGRLEELAAGRMLYNEFGTAAPTPTETASSAEGNAVPPTQLGRGGKNQPNVNLVAYDGRLLALSEGGHPTAVDPVSLEVQGVWDFHQTLPAYIPFTAHPKFDARTGEAFGFGVTQGPGTALNVFALQPDGRLETLHSLPQPGYFMIHDMLLSEHHLIFVIPPVQFDLPTLFSGQTTPAGALRYFDQQTTRFLIVRRDGTGAPVTAHQPAGMVFHNGNAFERDGKLVIDSILSANDDVLRLLWSYAKDNLEVPVSGPRLTRLVIDPLDGTVLSRTELENDQEFPRFDPRTSGRDARYLLSVEAGIPSDPLASTRLVRHDLHQGTARRVEAGPGRALGEAVLVPKGELADAAADGPGWVLQMGYDTERDQTFLDVRDAQTLDLSARVWTGFHFPLGFHGNFVDGARIV